MLNPTTEELRKLIDSVLKKHGWTKTKLAQELDTDPVTVSRWLREGSISNEKLNSLESLDRDRPPAVQSPTESSLTLPFTVTIPRNSIHVSTDGNGNINISGMIFAKLK